MPHTQAYPNLIHPLDVDIEQISRSTSYYDEDAREAIQQVFRGSKVTVKGQPRIRSFQRLDVERGGSRHEVSGYVLFRKRDLDSANITLQINDKITKIGNLTVEVFIERLEAMGHLDSFGGHTLMKAWITDRIPSKRSSI